MSAATASPSAIAWTLLQPPERLVVTLAQALFLVVSVAATGSAAWAQPGLATEAAAVADSAAVKEARAPADPPAAPIPLTPRQVLLRSAVVPGWGQVANGHPIKGLLFAGTTAGFLAAAVIEWGRIGETNDPATQEWRAARRNTRLLYFFTSLTAAALDAFVDAHLADFGDATELALAPVAGSEPGLSLACVRRF